MSTRVARRCAMAVTLTWALGLPTRPAAAEGVVVPLQRVENWSFRSELRAWQLLSDPSYTSVMAIPTGADPGGMRLINSHPGDLTEANVVRVGQCIPNIVGTDSQWSGEFMWTAPAQQQMHDGIVALFLDFYSGRACEEGTLVDQGAPAAAAVPPGGIMGWQLAAGHHTSNALSARSVKVIIVAGGVSPGVPFEVSVDQVQLLGGRQGFVKGDFDGGAQTDLLLRNTTTNEHRVWFLNREARMVEAPIAPAAPAGWEAVGVDDFNADGRNDLLMWNPGLGQLNLWHMNGIDRMGSPLPVSTPGSAWRAAATADFNRDGKPDIVFRNATSQALTIWLMNDSTHVGTLTPNPDHAADPNWELVGAGDLNGDLNPDLLWYNVTSGNITYWLMDASAVRTLGAFTNPPSAGGANWKVLAMGDYGIGPGGQVNTKDLVWRNATSGRMVLWFMDRSGNRTSGLFLNPDAPPAPATNWTIAGPR